MDIEAEAILPEIEEERCRFKDTDRWSKTAAHACTTPSSIEKVMKNLKKFTGRGPQQITPEVDKAASIGSVFFFPGISLGVTHSLKF